MEKDLVIRSCNQGAFFSNSTWYHNGSNPFFCHSTDTILDFTASVYAYRYNNMIQWRYSPTGPWPTERPPPVSEASANFCG
jgi:hypothetical protein